jgi:hypothetical protein
VLCTACALCAVNSIALGETPPEVDRVTPLKIMRYAQRLLEKYDSNRDGQLQQSEWSRMSHDPRTADANRDGTIGEDELARYIADYGRHRQLRLMERPAPGDAVLPPLLHPVTESAADESIAAVQTAAATGANRAETPQSSDGGATDEAAPGSDGPQRERARRDTRFFVAPTQLPQGLPKWFGERDADGDGQLSIAEFAPKASNSDFKQFARYDLNGDGLLTADEYLRSTRPAEKSGAKPAGKTKPTTTAKTEPAGKTEAAEKTEPAPNSEASEKSGPSETSQSADPNESRSSKRSRRYRQ